MSFKKTEVSKKVWPRLILSISTILALAGCVGSGGSSSDPSAPTAPQTSSVPSIAIANPASNTTTSGTILLSGTCTASISTVNVSGASPSTTTCIANGTFSVTITLPAPTGSKNITVSQVNGDGTGSDSRTFNLNSSVPNISIAGPVTNTITASTVTLQGSCDSSIPTINISGATPASTTCNGSFSQIISLSGADGNKTVTISQTNSSGTGSTSRALILDTTAPASTSIAINSGAAYTNTALVTLSLAATDSNSGIQMYVTNTAGCASGGVWEILNASKSWTLGQTNGTATVYVKYSDQSGNLSSCISNSIIHDNLSPTSGSISIDGGNLYTNTANVTLTLGAVGASQIYITNTASCVSGGIYEVYATSKPWTLSQTNTTATVYVKFKDVTGNESPCINVTIIHDNTAPNNITFSVPISNYITSQTSYTFSWGASADTVSGIKDYLVEKFSDANCVTLSTSAFQTTTTYFDNPLTTVGSLRISARDNALNLASPVCSSSVTKGATASLDTNFGSAGLVFTGTTGSAVDSIVAPDGKIIVASTTTIARYLDTGALDTSFNISGKYVIAGFSGVKAIAVQSDGKIIFGGKGPSEGFRLQRLNIDGTTDTNFGVSGIITTDFTNLTNEFVYALAIQTDGKILATGHGHNGLDYDIAIARYNTNGSLDTTFSGSGMLAFDIGAVSFYVSSITLQSDGKILIAGSNINYAALVKINSNGTLDTGFGTNGTSNNGLCVIGAPNGSAGAIRQQSDGKIVVVGSVNTGTYTDMAVQRLLSNGALDTAFNGTGQLLIATSTFDEYVHSVTIQTDGKILIGGEGWNTAGTRTSMTIARVTSFGVLDTTWNSTGILIHDFFIYSTLRSINILPDGKILAVGDSNPGAGYGFTINKYLQ